MNEFFQVKFVDHGNSQDILELRELPEDMKNIPPLAQRAGLLLTEGYKWTDDATDVISGLLDVEFAILEV